MTCHDAREQLSALLDDALAASERGAVETHLATCAECRRELTRLRETVALLERLPPVHAPAGFVDRVMAQTSRSSWRRRLRDALFLPLRVKLPLEAAALLLVSVSALYVYQRTPEVQHVARQEARESAPVPTAAESTPPKTLEPKRVPAAPQGAREEPSQAPPDTPPPVAPGQPGPAAQAFRAAPTVRREAGSEAKPQPAPPVKPQLKKEAPAARQPDAVATTSSSAGTEGATVPTGPRPARDTVGSRPPEAAAPVASAPPSAGAAPALEARSRADSGTAAAPPAAPPAESPTGAAVAGATSRSAARLTRAVDASGRLTVSARGPAEAAIDALLQRLGATRVARRLEGEQRLVVIDVLVPGARYPELVEGLGRIGRWVMDHEPRALPAEVRVEVALTVEP